MKGDVSTQYAEEGSSKRGRGKNKKFWGPEEDDALIKALHELTSDPKWKSENGFRSGYMNKLEEMICSKLPTYELKAEPHIESRIKHWSQKFNALSEMLGTSGFGWDDEKKLLVVDKAVYDEWVKTHKKAKGLYRMPFPYYDMLSEIYGKDRATGENVETFDDAIRNIEVEMENDPINVESNDDDSDEVSVTRSVRMTSSSQPSSRRSKKQKISKGKEPKNKETGEEVTSFHSFSSNFADIFQDMNAHLATMANTWSRTEEREQKKEEKLDSVLNDVLALDVSPSEALQATTILIAEEPSRRVFYSAIPALRRQYVMDLLYKK